MNPFDSDTERFHMTHSTGDIHIGPDEQLGKGFYNLVSIVDQKRISITAQGFLELAEWVNTWRTQLEKEVPDTETDEEREANEAIADDLSQKLGFDVRDSEQVRKFWLGAIHDLKGHKV